MTRKLLVLAAAFFILLPAVQAQVVTVAGVTSTAPNANNLAQILGGNGVTVTNATLVGANNSTGTFGSGNSIGITSGILLTTGLVSNAPGPNVGTGTGTDNNTAGDGDLDNIISGSNSSEDAAVLEFDVTPIGNSMSFRYVFASDEYPEYVCSNFNDVFAFFISGPNPSGGNYNNVNIATIPGSGGLPVAINTVNPGVAGASSGGGTCTSLAYSSLYNSNTGGANLEYDGFTDVFTAFAQVFPCSTYHLKLAIADVGDGSFDSGVFLEGNSFISQGTTVTAAVNNGFSNAIEGCVNGSFTITLPSVATSNTTVNYTVSGTATNGTDYTSIGSSILIPTGSQTGTITIVPTADGLTESLETVTISITNICDGTIYSTATVNITDRPVTSAIANPDTICPNGTTTLSVSGTVTGMTYSWSPTAGVTSPTAATTTATVASTQTYTVTVTTGTCTAANSALVTVSPAPSVIATVDSSVICNGETVQLNAAASGGTPGYTYGWSAGTSNSTISNPTATPTASTTYTVTVTDQNTCTATSSVSVTVQNPPVVSIGSNLNLCYNQVPTTLTATGGPYVSYNWSTTETTSTISVSTPGSYNVTVFDGVCSATSNTIVLVVFPETQPVLLVDTGMCPGETIILTADPGFTNVVWNTGATTNTIPVSGSGTFYYSALDLNGCVTTSDTVDVILASPPVVNATASPDTICAGDTATLSSGALAGLTYLWTPTGEVTSDITTTVPGMYIVEVSDAFCSTLDTVTLYQYTHAPITLGNDTSVCEENSVVLSPSDGPYVSYVWSTGAITPTITVDAPGSYTVTVNDGNCDYVSQVFVLSNFPVTISTANNDTILCIGQSFTITSSPAGMTNYLWNTSETTSSITVNTDGIYSFTATDANGCPTLSTTANVTFVAPPVIDAQASPDTICLGSSSQLNSGAGAGYYYDWTNGATTDTILVNTPGEYIVTVTAGACTSIDTVNVYQYPHAPVQLTYDQTLCIGDSIVLIPTDAPYLTYLWNTGATSDTLLVITPGDYWVTVTDTVCTYVSDTFTLSNFPVFNATAYTDTTLCQGQTFVVTSDAGLTNFLWSTGETTSTISVTTDGGYSYTALDANGCYTESDTADVTFVAPPVANATASPDTFCLGGSSVLNSGAGTGLTYLWSPNGEVTETITVTTPGEYIVTVSVGACSDIDTINVYQYQHAPVVIDADPAVCTGDTLVLRPTDAPYLTYLWSNGATSDTINVWIPGPYSVTLTDANCTYVSDTLNLVNYPVFNATAYSDTTLCTGQTFTVTSDQGLANYLWSDGSTNPFVTVTSTDTLWYTATDANGCPTSSDTAIVTFVGPPVANITATPDTLCAGGTSVLNSGAGAGLTYVWSPNGEVTETITVNAAGTYAVTVSAGSCSTSDTITIYQHTHAPVVLNNDTTVCPGASVVLVPSGSPYVSYNWSNGLSTATISVTATGNYWVTVNDGNCPYVSDTFTLSNFTVTNPSAYSDTSVCTGEPVTLTADGGYNGYTWNGTQNGQNITVTTAGTYSFTATDANGCSVQSNNVTVTNRPYPVVNITATPPAICVGAGSSTLDAGSQAGVTYTWSTTETTATILVTQIGTYSVTADNAGCTASGSININAAAPPVIDLQDITSCCQTVVLDPAPGQTLTYLWSDQSTGSTLTVTSTGNVFESYSVTVTNADGCTATAQSNVMIRCIDAEAFASPDTILVGDSSQLNVTTAYNTDFVYSWTPTTGLNNPSAQNPMASPADETTYTVVVADDEYGCFDTARITVYVMFADNVAIPNAFTPNRDGRNDVFYPVLLGSYQTVTEFRIYNRWGQLVHSSTNPWDGSFGSKDQPAGTYIYYVIIRTPDPENLGTTKDLKFEGSFSLLR